MSFFLINTLFDLRGVKGLILQCVITSVVNAMVTSNFFTEIMCDTFRQMGTPVYDLGSLITFFNLNKVFPDFVASIYFLETAHIPKWLH